MCIETRYIYGLSYHRAWRDFEYCSYALSTYDAAQGRATKKVCISSGRKAFQIGGLCQECSERALKAEQEAIAARDPRRR